MPQPLPMLGRTHGNRSPVTCHFKCDSACAHPAPNRSTELRVRATPLDRCEDVQPHPQTGKVYVACTNNKDRGADREPDPDAVNPRAYNKDGHVIEITERDDRVSATSFEWDLFSVCGDAGQAETYFGGWKGPVAPISCPDNIAFDSVGNLWIATDGASGSISTADGLFRVPVDGDERGRVVQFLAMPYQAETSGPVIHDRDESIFVCVQHPGEEGSWDQQPFLLPRLCVGGGETGARSVAGATTKRGSSNA
jgi:secreted PhoX family phosphatase